MAIRSEFANYDLPMLLANIVEWHWDTLTGRIVQELSRPRDRAFPVNFKGVENGLYHGSELPSLKMISDQTLGHLPQRARLNEEKELIHTQIC